MTLFKKFVLDTVSQITVPLSEVKIEEDDPNGAMNAIFPSMVSTTDFVRRVDEFQNVLDSDMVLASEGKLPSTVVDADS